MSCLEVILFVKIHVLPDNDANHRTDSFYGNWKQPERLEEFHEKVFRLDVRTICAIWENNQRCRSVCRHRLLHDPTEAATKQNISIKTACVH